MKEPQFSVHKSVVLSNRKALALYLFQIGRSHDVPGIMSQLSDLHDYKGDRVPLEVVTQDIKLSAQILQEEYLGLKIIDLIDIELLPLYKGITQCLSSLLKADAKIPFIVLCRLVSRYFKVITESVQVSLVEEKNLLRLDFQPNMPEQVSNHQIDGTILGVHKILSAFSSLRPVKLTLSNRQSTHGLEIYKKLLGVNPEISTPITSLYYELSVDQELHGELIKRDDFDVSFANNFFIGPLHNMLDKEFPTSSYQERCQHILITIMGIIEPTREQVAQVLNMSVSSLQRRLRDEGVTFQEILLKTRKIMAEKYLIEQQLPATDTAFLLGYQSSSQFFKAFKTWFNMTPMEYQGNKLS